MIDLIVMLMLAGGASQDEAVQPQPAAPARERRVCRSQETLGTILPRRVCRRVSEWAQIDAAQREITERDTAHMRNNGRGSLSDPACRMAGTASTQGSLC